jgi:hypothetical protein
MSISVTPIHDPVTGSQVDISGSYDGTRNPPPTSFHVFVKTGAGLVGLVAGDTNPDSNPRGFKVRIDRANPTLPRDDADLQNPDSYAVYWDFASGPKWEPGPLPGTPPPRPPAVFQEAWWVKFIVPGMWLFLILGLPVWLIIILAGLGYRAYLALQRFFDWLFH